MKGKALLTPLSRAASILLSRLSFCTYTFQQINRSRHDFDKLQALTMFY